MNLKRLLTTPIGRFFISIILGLGLATLFRKACSGKDCINFNGPVIDEINGKIYKFGEHCYKYELHPEKCDLLKQTVKISSAEDVSPKGIFE